MKVLSLNISHDSSAALFDNGKLIYFNQEERLSRKKRRTAIPFYCLKEIRKTVNDIDLLLLTGVNYEMGGGDGVLSIVESLGFNVTSKEWFSYYKPHHLSHACRSFFASNYEESIVIVWDGRGSNYNLSDGTIAYETTTAFHISYKTGINLLYKKLIRPLLGDNSDNNAKNLKILFSSEYMHNDACYIPKIDNNFQYEILYGKNDLGHHYSNITEHFGYNRLDCGKLMGLHSYGSENKSLANLISNEDGFKPDLFFENNDRFIDTDKFQFLKLNPKNEKHLLDFAYETQKGLEKIGLNFIQKILKKHPSNNLILTGGVSLNIVANSFYKKNLPKEVNLFVDPLCADEGNCFGSAQLYYYLNHHIKCDIPDTLYLCGNSPLYKFNLLENEQVFDSVDYSFVTDLLLNRNIVAIFQGKGEAGPRALGNRSILFDPRIKNGKSIVNTVKKRESFRPFACSILLEEAYKWFDMSLVEESPYMMYSFDALPGVKDIIPSVVHVDNTCRIQTVTEKQNYHYYNLIKDFYKKTEIPILFNTSFNLAGDPIVETIDDALDTLRRSELEYLYLPEIKKLIYVPYRLTTAIKNDRILS